MKHNAGRSIVTMLALAAAPLVFASADETPDATVADDGEVPAFEEYVEVNTTHLPGTSSIATKLEVPLRLTPANVGTVGAELMREQQSITLGDALRNVSSLNVQPGAGVFDYFVIRGFDAESSGLVLIDGAPEPESSFFHMYNAAGVELFKGPGGFLYGKDPLAGVINIVRKQPLPTNFTVLSGRLGSFSTYEGALDWNVASADGSQSFRLNGVYRESERFRDAKDSRHVAINPGARFELGESSVLSFNLEFVDAEYSPDAGIPLLFPFGPGQPVVERPDVPAERSYQTPFDTSEQELMRAQVDFEHAFDETLSLRAKAYTRTLDWNTAGTLFVGAFPDGGGSARASRTLTTLDDEQRFSGAQVELVAEFGSGPVRHKLLAGVEATTLDDDYSIGIMVPEGTNNGFPELPSIDLYDPVETATGIVTGPFQDGDTRYDVIAPYVIDQMSLPGNVELLLGARYDSIDFEGDFVQFGAFPARSERDDSDVSPMLGVLWAPSERLSLYANAASSFAPASPRTIGDLSPQDGEQIELGLKRSFMDGALRTTVSAFRIDRTNIGIPDSNGVTQQTGDQRSEGVELELAAEPRPGLRAFVSYAWIDPELTNFTELVNPGDPSQGSFDRSGNDPAFAPEHLGNVWISKRFGNGVGVGGGARYIGEQYVDEDNLFRIDDALVLDAAVFYDLRDWRLKLNLRNLTDEEYFVRGFGGTSVIPADAFAVEAGFEVRLP